MTFEVETTALENLVENVITEPTFDGVEPGEEEETDAPADEEEEGADEADTEAEEGAESDAE